LAFLEEWKNNDACRSTFGLELVFQSASSDHMDSSFNKISMLKKIDRSCRYDWLATKSLRAGYFPWAMLAYGLGMEY
jgi:hypothetical protein